MNAAIAVHFTLSLFGIASWWPVIRRRAVGPHVLLSTWNASLLNVVFATLSIVVLASLMCLNLLRSSSITAQVFAAALFPFSLGAGSMIALWLTNDPVRALFNDRFEAPRVAGLTLIRSAPFIAVSLALGHLMYHGPEEPAVNLLKTSESGTRMLAILSATILAPIGEELFFRGLIYRWLRGRMTPVLAATISALVFAVFHFHPASFPALLVFGISAAMSAEVTGGLTAPILFHILFNCIQLCVVFAT